MKIVLTIQTLLTLAGGLLLWMIYAPQQGFSFAAGSMVIVVSFAMMAVGYGLIFKKKMIALAIAIIVFKYAILGIIIFTLVKLAWFDPLWFSMGVSSFVFSTLGYAISESLKKENELKQEGN